VPVDAATAAADVLESVGAHSGTAGRVQSAEASERLIDGAREVGVAPAVGGSAPLMGAGVLVPVRRWM